MFDSYTPFQQAIDSIISKYNCSEEDAVRYLYLKEEGYSSQQAGLMAGISDPSDPSDSEI